MQRFANAGAVLHWLSSIKEKNLFLVIGVKLVTLLTFFELFEKEEH